MCIIALAHRASARHPLIVAANRDEDHRRATLAAAWWPDAPDVLGGRDAEAGGTWLAIGRGMRFAAVTNLRDPPPSAALPPRRSRGLLVNAFVTSSASANGFCASLAADAAEYGPFNLLLLDGESLCYSSNRAAPRVLEPGIHALSNAGPDVEWPKVTRAREGLRAALGEKDPTDALFSLLAERHPARDGFDQRQVSLFQQDPGWGTRSSTVIVADSDGRVRFTERSFDAGGASTGEISFEFEVQVG